MPTKTKEKTCYLLDGHSLTFKAYYAVRGLTNPQGQPTGAVLGFLRMLLKLIDDLAPEYLAVVFDTGKPTFRKEIYADYKANREAPPEDFGVQMGWIYQLLRAMGIATYEMEGLEADDLIATMAERLKEHDRAIVISADKDLFQLVDERVTVLRPGLDELKRFDGAAVEEKLGVRPDQIVDWLALVGDSSDNIPGVPGIGAKTAAKLLAEYQDLDTLLGQADQIAKPKLRQSLQEHVDTAHLARRLATVKRDAPLEWELESCRLPDDLWTEPVVNLLAELGFERVLRERGLEPKDNGALAANVSGKSTKAEEFDYRAVSDKEELAAWVSKAMEAPWLALDTETTSTDAMSCELVGISLSHRAGHAIYIPIGHRAEVDPPPQLALGKVRELLGPLITGRGPRLTAHHAKYDWKVLRMAGFEPAAPAFDSMIASYLLNPDRPNGHGLKTLGLDLCGIQMKPISDLIGSGRKMITMAEVTVADAMPYASMDADVTLRLREALGGRLEKIDRLKALMEELEMPLVSVLIEMEMGGFAIDTRSLVELGHTLRKSLSGLGKRIWDEAGRPFNIGSPKQVAQVLFEELKLKPGRRGKTGYSTNEAELERLSSEHPIPRLILEYRGHEKLKSTYVEVLPLLVNAANGRIHTSFNQTIAATGRLSSTDPNLQNIPIRSEMGRAIRRAFVPDRPDHTLIKADYSQIELRILAHVSQDPALSSAYHEGRDIHRQTASEVFGVPPEQVDREMRSRAKIINFGIIYGMSPHGLSQQLGISRNQAAEIIDRYFNTYPGVRAWIERLLDQARRTGWVETMLGRRRPVPDLNQRNRQVREAAERVAVNTPIQGTSADMIKRAMINIHRGLGETAPGARMVCQVHDELVFSVPSSVLESADGFIRRQMVEALPLNVPVEVDVSHGPNWAEC